MAAVWARARAEIRQRWRALVALSLLAGLGGGFVIAAAAGARRTDTVYQRFLVANRAADIELVDDNSDVATPIPVDEVERLPQVAGVGRYLLNYITIGVEDFAFAAPQDDRYGVAVDRIKIVSGRAPAMADEAAVSIYVAQRHNLKLGSLIPFFGEDAISYLANAGASKSQLRALRDFRLRVVGIEAGPGELPPQPIGSTAVHVTPALPRVINRLLPSLGGEPRLSLAVKLKDVRQSSAFIDEIQKLAGKGIIFSASQRDLGAGTQRSFHLQAIALWLMASLVGLVVLLVLSQSIARQTVLESGEAPTLRALGMGRGQLFVVGLARAGVVGIVGALIAGSIGYVLTFFSPLGLARTIEPSRGFHLDGAVVSIGAAALIGVTLLLAVIPSWRAARLVADETMGYSRTSVVAHSLASAGSPPSIVAGARLAFQTGRGRTAVPVRSSIAGATVGLAALVSALVFGASLIHLTRTPSLYGWHWDYAATSYGENDYGPYASRIAAVPGVAGYTLGSMGVALRVDGLAVGMLAVADHSGKALPPVLEGRGPVRANEIVLGTKALRELHKKIGDTVTVTIAFGQGTNATTGLVKPQTFTIVGRGVFPSAVDAELGRGAMATSDNFPDLPEQFRQVEELLITFEPGTDHAGVIAGVREALAPAGRPGTGGLVFAQVPLQTPSDLLSFGQVRNLPLILAGLLAVLAAATLAHTLVSSIHRRARDLAVLKTLGFVRSQVRAVVAWQSVFLALATLVIGVPTGIAVGRWTWTIFADRVGVVPAPRVPLMAVGLVIPAAVVLANLLGVVPARSAARTQPAIVLRTE
jgi:ABC-type lipoprotein release transport system permease subunit